jgi:hypothetical protein
VIEDRRKRIVGLGVRLERTKGLKVGQNSDELYEIDMYSEPTVMKNGIEHKLVSTNWEDDAHLVFEQRKPLPVTMLSLITDTEMGDDTD